MNTQSTFIEMPSEPMRDLYRTIQQVVASDLPFFITGETGVGKEGIAEYIHKSGPRRDKPLIAINCGRFPAELLQSELFGHEEGSFTGASHRRQGAFERVKGGVLFLDEIIEMSAEAQTMLLRVLDTKTFTRLGGNDSLTTDFQVIAATNRDIGEAVLKAEFRADLYYRLMGVMIHVPPLRERTADIAILVDAFIHELGPKCGRNVIGITRDALTRLERAAWPGNIRQLKTAVQTAIALATTDKLELKDFPYNFFASLDSEGASAQSPPRKDTDVDISTLTSQLTTLPMETRQRIIQTVSKHITTSLEEEIFCTKNMSLREILYQIASIRMKRYPTLAEAAASLTVDPRTLKAYLQPDQEEMSDLSNTFDFF